MIPSASSEAVIAELEKAHQALCEAMQRRYKGKDALEISIPARPDHDTDLVIGTAITNALQFLRLIDTGGQQELLARVDGERRAAGPTGSTAASNEAAPTVHHPVFGRYSSGAICLTCKHPRSYHNHMGLSENIIIGTGCNACQCREFVAEANGSAEAAK